MHAKLIALAVASMLPPMQYEHAALHGLTVWPHGYKRNPFLCRGPLTLRQHGLRLGIDYGPGRAERVVIHPVAPPRPLPMYYGEVKRHNYDYGA